MKRIIIGISFLLLACTETENWDQLDSKPLFVNGKKEEVRSLPTNQRTENLFVAPGWEIDTVKTFDEKFGIQYSLIVPTKDSPKIQKIIDFRVGELKEVAQNRTRGKEEKLRELLNNEDVDQQIKNDTAYSLNVEPQLLIEDSVWISIRLFSYWYEGGIHGLPEYVTINFNKKSNKEIAFEEYFQFNSFEDSIRFVSLINVQLDYTEELRNTEAKISSLYPLKFNIEEDSISFSFNAYELGPYGLGMPRIKLNKNQLGSLINEEYR